MGFLARCHMKITAATGATANTCTSPAVTRMHEHKAPWPGKATDERRQGRTQMLATVLSHILASGTLPWPGKATLTHVLQL